MTALTNPDRSVQSLIACAPDGALVADASGQCLDANDLALELLGGAREALLRDGVAAIFDPWPPRIDRGWDVAELRRNDGALIPIQMAASLMPAGPGDAARYAVFLRPVSQPAGDEAAWARLATIVASSPVPIIGMTPDGEIISWNPAAERLYGYSTAEVIGQSLMILRAPGREDDVRALIERTRRGESVMDYETIRMTKDGRRIHVSIAAAPVRDANGNIIAISSAARDVTALRQAEAALAQERDLLDAVMNHLPDAVYIKDAASRFVRLNRATARELGLSDPAEAIGRTDADFFPPSLAQEFLADERRLFATGEPMLNKVERQTESGSPRWVLATKVPLRDERGRIIGLVGSNRDITEQLRLQRERDRLHRELEAEIQRAAEVQAQLLPHAAPDLPGYEFAGICLPARQVGGDFFDWLGDGCEVRLSLGDVMGKGLPASLLTATVRAALRSVAHLPLPAAVEAVNRALFPDLSLSDSFITLVHVGLEATSGRLTYIDAGHGMAFVQRRDGGVEPLRGQGVPLGILPDAVYPVSATRLEPGDTLVLYSDGLPDARPDVCLDAVAVAAHLDGLGAVQEKLERLVALATEATTRPDDLTLVLVRRQEEPVTAAEPLTPRTPSR